MIRTNIQIYSYQTNDTNMIQMNIRIGKYSNIRIKFLMLVLDLMLDVGFLMCDTTQKLKKKVDTTKGE